MRPRTFFLPVAAIVIALLCAFKLTRTYPTEGELAAGFVAAEQQAPPIELLDQNKPSEFVRLRRHLDHAQVLVVFFDGEQGAGKSAALLHLRDRFDALKSSGTAVLAVSTALPQQNRKVIEAIGSFPFPLLSDPDFSVHRAWGRFDKVAGQPLTGIFLVNRAGRVRWSRTTDFPEPIKGAERDVAALAERLLNGNPPE